MLFKVVHYETVPIREAGESGAKGVRVRWLISKEDGAENFAMRYFEVEPDGQTPYHSHNWEHEVFILDGEGLVVREGSSQEIASEYVVFVPPNIRHCFKNTGQEKLRFLCLIPYER